MVVGAVGMFGNWSPARESGAFVWMQCGSRLTPAASRAVPTGLASGASLPRADALGYYISPLRGSDPADSRLRSRGSRWSWAPSGCSETGALLGRVGLCLDAMRLAGLRPLRQVSPLRDSRSGYPYPGLTPWAITISPLRGLEPADSLLPGDRLPAVAGEGARATPNQSALQYLGTFYNLWPGSWATLSDTLGLGMGGVLRTS